jgi:hypothetical protein
MIGFARPDRRLERCERRAEVQVGGVEEGRAVHACDGTQGV